MTKIDNKFIWKIDYNYWRGKKSGLALAQRLAKEECVITLREHEEAELKKAKNKLAEISN